MPPPSPASGAPAWLRRPRRTARLRFTAVYGGLFLLSGAALIAITYGLFERATRLARPQLPQIPSTPAIHDVTLKGVLPGPLGQFVPKLITAQRKLAVDQLALAKHLHTPGPVGLGAPRIGLLSVLPQITRDQRQLSADQHQLTAVQRQLTAAVHQVAHAGAIQAAQRATDAHQLLIDSGVALAIVAVLGLLAGWLVAGRMLRPLRTITRTARRISSASLHERLALEGPQDELKELGDTLDELLDRLEASFEAQRRFVANASHELRTPLARQRALIQVALADPQASFASLRAAHERVLASEHHLEQMIDGLLTLTRGQAGLERREHLDLAPLASRSLLARGAEAAERGIETAATLAAAPTDGDPRLIERLIANLLENAIRHNAPGGRLEIATGVRGERPFLAITNSGPRVPPEEIGRLFQPFQRLGDARTRHNSGHGLGLSIVQAIADAHGAAVSAHALPEGGLGVEVLFQPAGAGASAGGLAAPGPASERGTRALPALRRG